MSRRVGPVCDGLQQLVNKSGQSIDCPPLRRSLSARAGCLIQILKTVAICLQRTSRTLSVAAKHTNQEHIWASAFLFLTNCYECMLQLQGEGRQRDFFWYRQDCHSGKIGGLASCIPLTARSVEGQTASWGHARVLANAPVIGGLRLTHVHMGHRGSKPVRGPLTCCRIFCPSKWINLVTTWRGHFIRGSVFRHQTVGCHFLTHSSFSDA